MFCINYIILVLKFKGKCSIIYSCVRAVWDCLDLNCEETVYGRENDGKK